MNATSVPGLGLVKGPEKLEASLRVFVLVSGASPAELPSMKLLAFSSSVLSAGLFLALGLDW